MRGLLDISFCALFLYLGELPTGYLLRPFLTLLTSGRYSDIDVDIGYCITCMLISAEVCIWIWVYLALVTGGKYIQSRRKNSIFNSQHLLFRINFVSFS